MNISLLPVKFKRDPMAFQGFSSVNAETQITDHTMKEITRPNNGTLNIGKE